MFQGAGSKPPLSNDLNNIAIPRFDAGPWRPTYPFWSDFDRCFYLHSDVLQLSMLDPDLTLSDGRGVRSSDGKSVLQVSVIARTASCMYIQLVVTIEPNEAVASNQ